MKKLVFILAALTAVAYGQGGLNNPPRFIFGTTVVSGLPAAASATNQFWAVTDGASASDCATGSGTSGVVCWSNGVVWAAVGAAGGSGTVTSVTGAANQIDVATGTTTPVISLDPALILPTGTTLVAPALGTPASGVITNLTGTCAACTANAATTAANLSGTPTLPNGTAATTQAGSDSTTKLATTAQVQAAIVANAAPLTSAQSAPAFFAGTTATGPYENYYEQFYGNPALVSATIGAASGGNTCTSAVSAAADANHPVYENVTSGTGGAATGQSCVFELSATNLPVFVNANTTPAWAYETSVQPSVLPGTTAAAFQAGVVTTVGVEPWTTGIGFHLANSTGVANDWFCRYASTEIDSTIAATVAWHRLRIVSDGVNVHWYIDGTERCGTGVAIASMPSGRLFPAATSVAGSGTSVSIANAYYLAQRNSVR